jgi:cell division protein FtsW (lipid II flippase)
MSSREMRYAGAVFIGVIFDAVFFWKFLPYSTRERGPDLLPWYLLPILAFLAGLLLTMALDGKKRWIPVAMFGGFSAANACLIVADCSADPTNHNLWPFEFVLIAAATAPAFLGAGISHFIGRVRKLPA